MSPEQSQHPSFCRFCHNGCPILVDVTDGRPVRIAGDPGSPVYGGYTCVKGRALAVQHTHPERLLHSQRQVAAGHEPVASGAALDDIADSIDAIRTAHGPDAVALYIGTMTAANPIGQSFAKAFMRAIGSRMIFTTTTIDQPGKPVAQLLHGMWLGGAQHFSRPDVGLIFGGNPLVTYTAGLPAGNPTAWLRTALARGFQLIVVDPRRSNTAKYATLHLQPRPGYDAEILAAMIRTILREDLHDVRFLAEEATGLEALSEAVEPFTPELVGRRAGLEPADLAATARIYGSAERGYAVSGTGTNMSGPAVLVEYLILSLNTLCGRWLRAGDRVEAPTSLIPAMTPKAQAVPASRGYGLGDPLPATGLTASAAGLPTAALPAEILQGGEHRVRALISLAGNPVAAWPDQIRTIHAMRELDLLVQIDIKMSATAKLAHYVVAPKMSLETPACTMLHDAGALYSAGFAGFDQPWAQYTPAIVEPPAGSDLLEEWEFFYELARRMKLRLTLPPPIPVPGAAAFDLDMHNKPTTDELLEWATSGSRIPLSEVRKHPHGALFADPPVVVAAKDADWPGTLDIGNAQMMADLAAKGWRLPGAPATDPPGADGTPAFRLVPRRIQQMYNSSGHALPGMRRRPYNPAFINPEDLELLGIEAGSHIELYNARGSIPAIAQPDDAVRRGLVSMTHCFGDVPERDSDYETIGSNPDRLLSAEAELQPYTGQPLMSNVPVWIRRAAS